MGRSIHDVLLALGAKAAGRDGSAQLVLDLSLLDMSSVFGGDLAGDAVVAVTSPEAIAFHKPAELAACGTLWLPGVETAEALSQAIIDAHDHVRTRLDDDQQTLKRLGMKPRLVAPDPRARAKAAVGGRSLQVAIDGNGDLILEAVDGNRVSSDDASALTAEDADAPEIMRRLEKMLEQLEERGVVAPHDSFDVDVDVNMDDDDDDDDPWAAEGSLTQANAPDKKDATAQTRSRQNLSEEQLAELHAALHEESDSDEIDASEGHDLIDASDEAEPVQEPIGEEDEADPTLSVTSVPDAARILADDDDEPKTVSIATRKPSSLLSALETGMGKPSALPPPRDGDDDDDADADAHDDGADAAAADDDVDDDEGDDGGPRHERAHTPVNTHAHPLDDADDDGAFAPDQERRDTTALPRPDDAGVFDGPRETKALPRPDDPGATADADDDDDAPAGLAGAFDDDDDGGGPTGRDAVGAKHGGDDDARADADDGDDAHADARDDDGHDGDDDGEDDGDAFDDHDDPTRGGSDGSAVPATRPGLSTRVETVEKPAPGRATKSPFAAREMAVEDFPALPADSEDNEPAPTSINTPDGAPPMASELVSSPPTLPLQVAHKPNASSEDELEAIARGFDDGEAAPASRPRAPLTVEAPAEPSTNVPTKATVSREPAASDAAAPVVAAPAADVDNFVDEDDIQTRAVSILGVQGLLAKRSTDEEVGSEDPAALEARAHALEEEARALRERAAELRAKLAPVRAPPTTSTHTPSLQTASTPGAAVTANLATLPPPSAAPARSSSSSLPVIASMEVEAVDDARVRPPSSPAPPTQSVPPPQTAATFDDDDDQPAIPVSAARAASEPPSGFVADDEEIDEGPPGTTRASDEGVSLAEVQAALGDIASLPGEATQVGALRDGRFTDLRQPHSSDGSDVFSTGAPTDRPAPSERAPTPPAPKRNPTTPPAPAGPAAATVAVPGIAGNDGEMDEDSLEIAIGNGRLAAAAAADDHDHDDGGAFADAGDDEGTGAIGLVVEDAKARDRLKKHLSPRFKELIEAPDASTAASLPDVEHLEAIVFVRPRPDDATREGIEMLCERPKKPRILVISSDVRFDEMPEVSLRLPLGQRASEVAQQVVDGLKTLGVHCIEGSEGE